MDDQDTAPSGRTLRRRIDQLELRLREADHRIANSLQLASAIAHHQAAASGDPRARLGLLETQRFIDAIAGVHQLLGEQPEAGMLAMPDYLGRLVARLQGVVSAEQVGRAIQLQADPIQLPPEIAVWVGMVVTELVANAGKYGGDGSAGAVQVSFRRAGAGFRLEVADGGAGFDLKAPPRGSGLGRRLIRALAHRVGGDFHYRRQPQRTTAIFTAPDLAGGVA